MTNDDLKRFYETNATPEKNKDVVRYDENGNINVGNRPGAHQAISKGEVEQMIAAFEAGEINMDILADASAIVQSQEGFIIQYYNGGTLLLPLEGSQDIILDVSEDGTKIIAKLDETLKLAELPLTEASAGMYISTLELKEGHVQVLFEVETEGTHAGADFILHPYNSAICYTTFNLLIGGQFVNGFAYINESGKVNISLPQGITATEILAHYRIIK